MSKSATGGGYKSHLLSNSFKALCLFFCTAVFSAVFFGSVDYIRSADAAKSEAAVNLNINPVLSIRIAKNNVDINELSLAVDPIASGRFKKDDLDVIVSTSNETGYTLTFADKDTDTAMHHTDTAITTTIPSITANTAESSFPVNSWGYSLEDISSSAQTFNAIPTSSAAATIKTTTAPVSEDTTPVTFATKVDTTITAGTYLDTVVFSATTNYVQNALERLITMQNMTPEACANATIGDEAILTDTRDNKTYVVRKLADGNCWMVQNLALGGTSPITLTPADSNVSANWVLDASSSSFGTTNDAAGINIKRMNSTYQNAWVDENNAIQTTGTPSSQTQYIGNYYNWYTATAGSGTYSTVANSQVPESICPKGWRLPTGGAIDASTGNGEFQQLYDAYGSHGEFVSATSPAFSGGWQNSESLWLGTANGWWSRTNYIVYGNPYDPDYYAYVTYLNSTTVGPQNNGSKKNGYSVRCVAEDKDITGITTMQQMTPSVCAVTKTPSATDTTVPENTLTDVRDGNTYLVRKLADGNCWMSQNLNLTLSTATALNSTTSDLSPGRTWTPQNNTQTTDGVVWAQDSGNVARSMNPGNIYFPGGVGTGTADAYGNLQGTTSGEPWEAIGNYYNWYAATAGTGTAAMVAPATASDSICPKGWKLPDNEGTKSFVNLVFTTYGLQDNDATSSTKLLAAPLNFVRSGLYYWSNSQVSTKGAAGYWWSTAASSTAVSAQHLDANSTRVTPQYAGYKGHGITVRCVAR